jgi:hypothetical protein
VKHSRALPLISLAVALVAIIVAISSWFQPLSNDRAQEGTPQQPSAGDPGQAQANVCNARSLVARATQNAGNQSSDDPTVSFIIAVNVRLGATASADYLYRIADNNEAAPESLLQAVRELAAAYQETTLLHLADARNDELDKVYKKLDDAGLRVDEECG